MKKEYKSLIEELNRINELSGIKLNENNEYSDWNTVYTWTKLFTNDDGDFLRKNNITSGVWLKKDIESGKITVEDIDKVTRESDGVKFSELSMVKSLLNKI